VGVEFSDPRGDASNGRREGSNENKNGPDLSGPDGLNSEWATYFFFFAAAFFLAGAFFFAAAFFLVAFFIE
jgi:hypothetical protein